MKIINLKNEQSLKEYIREQKPTLYVGSQTSTVIAYDKILPNPSSMQIGNLATMEPQQEIDSDGNLIITGAVTWQEAKDFCLQHGRKIMTSPTEELALCLSGIATSATGERCFKFGTLREQLISVTYIDHNGQEVTLNANESIESLALFQDEKNKSLLSAYQEDYAFYRNFKNAPYPRFEKATDLMVGTEGQLGVIIRAVFKTTPANNEMYIFLRLPRWEENYLPHLEVYQQVQKYRGLIESVEFIDENSLSYLPEEMKPTQDGDLLFLEIDQSHMDELYENLLSNLKNISEDDIFQMDSKKCRELRMSVPRYIFEKNQQMGVVKMGTDVQVTPDTFSKLLDYYRSWKDTGIAYNLFGHFGDAHLHFNFMPTPDKVEQCQEYLKQLYHFVKDVNGSPFAEHGIGLVKKKFIQPFYGENQKRLFQLLKSSYDPKNIFFPEGFMHQEGLND